jgi:hypothetical protein
VHSHMRYKEREREREKRRRPCIYPSADGWNLRMMIGWHQSKHYKLQNMVD